MPAPTITDVGKGSQVHVQESVSRYSANFEEKVEEKSRLSQAREVTQTFYTLVTDFYEYGWGQSFHFAPVFGNDPLPKCLADYEKDLASSINARPGMKILDVGCGVGGPSRQIAKFSGAHVTGINCSDYQVKRAKTYAQNAQLQDLCDYVVGDFCNMVNFEDGTFDGGFCLEATCHAEDLKLVYKEVYRTLKPGALYADSAWVLTEKYDASNPEHVKIKDGICLGNSLPTLRTKADYVQAMEAAGFQIKEVRDCRHEGDLPWYIFLTGKSCMSLESFRASACGRMFTHGLLTIMECMHLAPRGSTQVHSILITAADNLIAGGKLGIFSPMTRIVAQKPM